jgi:hypothetical protein
MPGIQHDVPAQDMIRAIRYAAVMIGSPTSDSRARRLPSPETMPLAWAATAQAHTTSSSGATATTGAIGVGTPRRASAAYQRPRDAGYGVHAPGAAPTGDAGAP